MGLWSTAPARIVRKMRRHAPAMRTRETRASIGPIKRMLDSSDL